MRKLFIVGFPGLYGGAATELNSQIVLWNKSFPEIELNIIPTMQNSQNEPLHDNMVGIGVKIHGCRDYSMISHEDAVINFCSSEFLNDLDLINLQTKRVMWVNCMTFLFPKEKEQASKGLISHYLYQRDGVLKDHKRWLEVLGAKGEFMTFAPFFDDTNLEFSVKEQERVHIGRISRQDADKFSINTLHIYEYIVSPKMKQGHFLGFDQRSESKIGKPHDWIKTYKDHREFSVSKFYDQVDFVVQPTDTTENLPRIGFEAQYSGKPLVVDNRGGWQTLIEHKHSGFLCDTPRDFIYWGSRLAYEPDLRLRIAENARKRAIELSGLEVSTESWKKVFESVYNH